MPHGFLFCRFHVSLNARIARAWKLPASINSAKAVSLFIPALVRLAISLLIVVLVAVAGAVAAVGMPVIAVFGRPVAVPGLPVSGAIVQAVLIAILARRACAVAASTIAPVTSAV